MEVSEDGVLQESKDRKVKNLSGHNSAEMGSKISPYLAAIQSLNGKTPEEKFKSLNKLINTITTATREPDKPYPDLTNVPSALTPLVQVIIARRTKNLEAIMEALKSDNCLIVKQALHAKFFFDPNLNPQLNVKFFKEQIMPHISLYTRKRIIKILSFRLTEDPSKAEEFFEAFVQEYGVYQAVPLLISCREEFTYKAVLQHKVFLPIRTVQILFQRNPKLVIRYLNLANTNNSANKNDRESHEISIHNYYVILPKLIKNFIGDFISLYELTPWKHLNLHRKKTEAFVKNAVETLIQKPTVFLKILNLKVVSQKLSETEFEKMFLNLKLQKTSDIWDFNEAQGEDLDSLIQILKFYPNDKKVELLKKTFTKHLNQDFMDMPEYLATPDLLVILPESSKETAARILIEHYKDCLDSNTNLKHDWRCYLPPKESIPLFQILIKQESDLFKRANLISKMVYSCHIYNNKEYLTQVLEYYNTRHKNEQALVFTMFMSTLCEYFEFKHFKNAQWTHLREMIMRAHVKNEFLILPSKVIESIIEASLKYILVETNCKINEELQSWHNFILNLIEEFFLSIFQGYYDFLKYPLDQHKFLLDKYILKISQNIQEGHQISKNQYEIINTVINAVKSIHNFNQRLVQTAPTTKGKNLVATDIRVEPMEVRNYPWIASFIEEILTSNSKYNIESRFTLKKLLKRHEPELYKRFVHEESKVICNVSNGEALDMLKINSQHFLSNWEVYLTGIARDFDTKISYGKHSGARKLLQTIKWYGDIPTKFVENSLDNIQKPGYALILGILLEGPSYGQVIASYLPKQDTLKIISGDSKKEYELVCSVAKGLLYPNPPVQLEVMTPFCESSDYIKLVLPILNNIVRRLPTQLVKEYSQKLLASSKKISTEKLALRLIMTVLPQSELIKVLAEMWDKKTHISIRELLANEILNVFKDLPNDETWNLIKKCMLGMGLENEKVLDRLINLQSISKKYIDVYINEILAKIEECTTNSVPKREHYITRLINSLDPNLGKNITEETYKAILNKYFFHVESREISRCLHSFVIRIYLLDSPEVLESRLDTVLELLRQVAQQWMVPHPTKPRYYPANSTITDFVKSLTQSLFIKDQNPRSKLIIEKLLGLFPSPLQPWQEPEAYLMLNLQQCLMAHTEAKDFGQKCSIRLPEFVDLFSTELILDDIADCMSNILQINESGLEYRLGVLEGLMLGNSYHGSLVTIKLLEPWKVSRYDERYEGIIEALRLKQDFGVQCNLNKFLNSIDL